MGFLAFIMFALICLDALAWPLFVLGYPLLASIHAIENNDTEKLITYWVIFSLISLFEHAFMGMLQWLPLWRYLKLMIICWMVIPQFDGAFYVYDHFVRPCTNVDMQTICYWFNKFQGLFLKDYVLAEADKDVKGFEKLIASESKGMNSSILQKDMKAVQVTEKKEVGPVNLIPEIEPHAAKKVDGAVVVPEKKGEAGFCCLEIPPSDRQQDQKEWACAMCQVTTTSETTLKSHLQGRRHRDTLEELMKAKNQLSEGKVSYASVVKAAKHSGIADEEPSSNATTWASQKMQQPSSGQVSAFSVATNTSNTNKSNVLNDEPKKSFPNNSAGKQEVKSQKKVGKKPQFRCTICNIYCSRSEDLNCHLWGKKHLARIQELNSLAQGDLA